MPISREEMQRANEVLRKWLSPFYPDAPEPTARQILLAVASEGRYGHPRTVADVFEGELTHHWLYRSLSRPEHWEQTAPNCWTGRGPFITPSQLDKAVRLLERYKSFVRWMNEGRHAWKEIERIFWADNSVTVTEQSRMTGETRSRMVIAPGGDVCY